MAQSEISKKWRGAWAPERAPRDVQRIAELEAFVARIAALAPEQHWSDDAFAPEPPEWARYEGFGMHGDQCCRCGAWCSIVRPGKTQCDVCCDDNMTALAIEAKRLVETQS